MDKNLIGKSLLGGLLGVLTMLAVMFIRQTMIEHGTFTFDGQAFSKIALTFVAVSIGSYLGMQRRQKDQDKK